MGLVTERVFTIKNALGLHARPAAAFAQEAARHKCSVVVVKDGLEVSGKSVMGLMLLAAECGSKLTVKVDGVDEDKALDALGLVLEKKFDEKF
jgi:phosphocarrier protein